MMMYLEIQPIAFRCKFFMHVSVKDMREKVSLMHNISMLPRICKSISDNCYGLTLIGMSYESMKNAHL